VRRRPLLNAEARWPAPTLRECLVSCIENARQAENAASVARAHYLRLDYGDPTLPRVVADLSRHQAEAKHWKGLAEWHREQIKIAERPGRGGDA
jgi:hypothetical protein